MSGILLDTSAYSAFFRGHRGAFDRLQRASSIALSVVTLGELHAGFRRGSQLARNLEELEAFLSSPRVRLLATDDETAHCYGVLFDSLRRAGKPIPVNDVWIASAAYQHALEVLTLDAHFLALPQLRVELLGPEEAQTR